MKDWTLSRLAEALPACELLGEAKLRRLQIDSRLVEPGDLFAALPGLRNHGLEFLPQALAAGAVAVLAPAGSELAADLPAIFCEDATLAAGRAAHLLAGNPTKDWPLLAVTGTNGKSTSAALLAYLMSSDKAPWGLLGTLDYRVGGRVLPSSHTTPDAARLAGYLAEMRAAGLGGAAMEASSHALDQQRLAGCRLAGALFTNISRDHLDYHGDMENYVRAKARLFDHLEPGAPVVVNADDERLLRLADELADRPRTFGTAAKSDARILEAICTVSGSDFQLEWAGNRWSFRTSLPGFFNVMNTAGALALALALGESPDRLRERLASFSGVPGRMQRLDTESGPAVLLDFAHTPDAILNVSRAARLMCEGKLRLLFGAGGDRDRGKRPLMAKAAQECADIIYLTSDNPRGEDPEKILDEVESGFDAGAASWKRIADRREAIFAAIDEAAEGDLILLLGKGHETTQEIAGLKHPFSDGEVAREALRARGWR